MRRLRIGLAAIAGCEAALTLYAALRVYQAAKGTEPNPALILWSAHAGYFWRAWISAYVGGMVALAIYVVSAKRIEQTTKWLATSLFVAVLAITAQGILVP